MAKDFEYSFETSEGWTGATLPGNVPPGWDGHPGSTDRNFVTSSEARAGSQSLQMHYTDLNTGSGPFIDRQFTGKDSVYVAFWYKCSSGFQTSPAHTKIMACSPGVYPSVWCGMGLGGPKVLDLVLQGAYDTTDSQNLYSSASLVDNTWTRIIYLLQMNTPGQANGSLQLFVDGVRKLNVTGRQLRGPTPTSTSWAGPCPSTAVWNICRFYQERGIGDTYYDVFSVSPDYPDAGGGGGDVTPPPVPNAPTITSGGSLPAVYTWSAVADPGDLAGYNIYRKEEACAGAAPTFIAAVGNVLTYTDTTIPNATATICVKIASRDTSGNVSALSTGTAQALTPFSEPTLTPVYSDPFTRANSASLGANWTAGYTPDDSPAIVSNTVQVAQLNNDCMATHIGSLTGDQYVDVKLTLPTATTVLRAPGVFLRANAVTKSGMSARVLCWTSSPLVRIDKWANGSSVVLGSVAYSWVSGNILRFWASGTTYRVYSVDAATSIATLLLSVTDPDYNSGRAGIISVALTGAATTDHSIDDFVSGNLTANVGESFAHVASVHTDATGADITFTGLAHKVRYWNDLHVQSAPVEITGLGGVTSYRLTKTWEATVTFACFEAQGSDGVWETAVLSSNYICAGVTPGTTDITPPAAPTGLAVR